MGFRLGDHLDPHTGRPHALWDEERHVYVVSSSAVVGGNLAIQSFSRTRLFSFVAAPPPWRLLRGGPGRGRRGGGQARTAASSPRSAASHSIGFSARERRGLRERCWRAPAAGARSEARRESEKEHGSTWRRARRAGDGAARPRGGGAGAPRAAAPGGLWRGQAPLVGPATSSSPAGVLGTPRGKLTPAAAPLARAAHGSRLIISSISTVPASSSPASPARHGSCGSGGSGSGSAVASRRRGGRSGCRRERERGTMRRPRKWRAAPTKQPCPGNCSTTPPGSGAPVRAGRAVVEQELDAASQPSPASLRAPGAAGAQPA